MQSFFQGGGQMLLFIYNLLWIEGPGANGPFPMIEGQEVIHVFGLGLELQDPIPRSGEKGDGLVCKADDSIEGQTIPQLPRAKPEDAMRMCLQHLLKFTELDCLGRESIDLYKYELQ